jgi:carbon monoxide dehydrogenase subunit G
MEFRRNARINAPLADTWALVDDIPTVASCIPASPMSR